MEPSSAARGDGATPAAAAEPGAAAPTHPPHDPLDADFLRHLMQNLYGPIVDGYFRSRMIGAV